MHPYHSAISFRCSVIQQTFTKCLVCLSSLLSPEDREIRQAGLSSPKDLPLREKGPVYTHKYRHTGEQYVWEGVNKKGSKSSLLCVRDKLLVCQRHTQVLRHLH